VPAGTDPNEFNTAGMAAHFSPVVARLAPIRT
jgi:hypothetical protein